MLVRRYSFRIKRLGICTCVFVTGRISVFAQEESAFTKTVMDKVQSSYQRSLQEVGELLRKRSDTLKSLKI